MLNYRSSFVIPGRRPALAGSVMLLLALAACSASASPAESAEASLPAESAAASTAASAAESAAPSEGAQSGEITVNIVGRSFGGDLTITAGSSVVFVNQDSVPHTVTNGTDGVAEANPLFDVSLPDGATSDPIVFDAPGTYHVTCEIHSSMNMTITVE